MNRALSCGWLHLKYTDDLLKKYSIPLFLSTCLYNKHVCHFLNNNSCQITKSAIMDLYANALNTVIMIYVPFTRPEEAKGLCTQ